MTNLKHQTAMRLLAKQRQMTSLVEQEIISSGADFVFDKTDWVPLYFDKGYAVTSDCGGYTAYRAVTLECQLLWLVFSPDKARGFHASAMDPVQAVEDAKAAWAKRRMVRQNWKDVERTARDLITGRQSFDVTLEDAHASPLCALGIEGFLRGIGLPRVTRMSGRLAGMLMKVEPQLGFVIFEAMQRQTQAEKSELNAVPVK